MCLGGSSAPARGRSRHRQKVRGTESEGAGSAREPSRLSLGPWGDEGRDGRARNRGAEVAGDHHDRARSPRAGTSRWAAGQVVCTAPCARAGCAGSGVLLGIPGGHGARASPASPAVRNQPGDTPFPPAAPGTPRGPGRGVMEGAGLATLRPRGARCQLAGTAAPSGSACGISEGCSGQWRGCTELSSLASCCKLWPRCTAGAEGSGLSPGGGDGWVAAKPSRVPAEPSPAVRGSQRGAARGEFEADGGEELLAARPWLHQFLRGRSGASSWQGPGRAGGCGPFGTAGVPGVAELHRHGRSAWIRPFPLVSMPEL